MKKSLFLGDEGACALAGAPQHILMSRLCCHATLVGRSSRQTGNCFPSKVAGNRCLNHKTPTRGSAMESQAACQRETHNLAAGIDSFFKLATIETPSVCRVCGEGEAEVYLGSLG